MKELLVPVGSMEVLKVAVLNGCDAVYLSGYKFGARAYADNFSENELREAVTFCHLYGVKIYITVNTLIYESELNDVLKYLKYLNEINVDAVIVQDLGIISVIKEYLPDLEVHASTQVHTLTKDTIEYLEKLGVKRVVFARELSVDKIKNMNINIEKEVFIHGALCVSYSGECLISSILKNRSGNRGECAGFCRLPYKIKENNDLLNMDGDYLISMKDLNTSSNFIDILQSDIYSLKIEGRMKSPEYVGCVTRLYRDLLDKYYNHQKLEVNLDILNDLKIIYNREFTKGFICNEDKRKVINIKNPNHIGSKLGEVIKIDSKYIYIKLLSDIFQGDGIRFLSSNDGGIINFLYNEKKLLEKNDVKGNIILVDNKYKTKIGDIVNKTSSMELVLKYTKNLKKDVLINLKFVAKEGFMQLIYDDGINIVRDVSNEVYIAKNAPIKKDDILNKLKKLGNTPFKLNHIEINIESNLFINMSLLNKMRQKLIDELINLRTQPKNIKVNQIKKVKHNYNMKNNISILVRNEKQLRSSLDLVDRIYVTDEEIFNKYKDTNKVYFRTSRVSKKVKYDNLLITELTNINSGKNRVFDYYLNTTNHYTNNLFKDYINTLSVELSDDEISKLCEYYDYNTNFEIIVYGKLELMLMKYCPMNALISKSDKCNLCLKNKYYLIDSNKLEFRLLTDYDTHTVHLMDYKNVNKIDKIKKYLDLGIHNFRLEFIDETSDEVISLIKEVKKII